MKNDVLFGFGMGIILTVAVFINAHAQSLSVRTGISVSGICHSMRCMTGRELNYPHLEVWEMVESCSLDVADRGEHSMREVADMVNVTYQRVQAIEVRLLRRLSKGKDWRDG